MVSRFDVLHAIHKFDDRENFQSYGNIIMQQTLEHLLGAMSLLANPLSDSWSGSFGISCSSLVDLSAMGREKMGAVRNANSSAEESITADCISPVVLQCVRCMRNVHVVTQDKMKH